jgi:hypothetical protein
VETGTQFPARSHPGVGVAGAGVAYAAKVTAFAAAFVLTVTLSLGLPWMLFATNGKNPDPETPAVY